MPDSHANTKSKFTHRRNPRPSIEAYISLLPLEKQHQSAWLFHVRCTAETWFHEYNRGRFVMSTGGHQVQGNVAAWWGGLGTQNMHVYDP